MVLKKARKLPQVTYLPEILFNTIQFYSANRL